MTDRKHTPKPRATKSDDTSAADTARTIDLFHKDPLAFLAHAYGNAEIDPINNETRAALPIFLRLLRQDHPDATYEELKTLYVVEARKERDLVAEALRRAFDQDFVQPRLMRGSNQHVLKWKNGRRK